MRKARICGVKPLRGEFCPAPADRFSSCFRLQYGPQCGKMNLLAARLMNTSTPEQVEGRKALARRRVRPSRRCRRCPYRTPSGQCLDPSLKNGRCGDWVWYTVGAKQLRRLWVKPRDPRTPSQRLWRKRLRAASRKYSQSLTNEQQDACIAAGAKRQSRPCFGQSGLLTGQQYWVSNSNSLPR